jgi:hypothetical protein
MRDAQKGRKSWLERLTSPPESETEEQYPGDQYSNEQTPYQVDPRSMERAPARDVRDLRGLREDRGRERESSGSDGYETFAPPVPAPTFRDEPRTPEPERPVEVPVSRVDDHMDFRPRDLARDDRDETTEPGDEMPTGVPGPSSPSLRDTSRDDWASPAPAPVSAAEQTTDDGDDEAAEAAVDTPQVQTAPAPSPWQPDPAPTSSDDGDRPGSDLEPEVPVSVEDELPQGPSEEEQLEAARKRHVEELQHRWLVTQAQLLDDPRDAVREAGLLIGDAMQFVTSTFTDHRDRIEREWKNNDQLNTDELRTIMRRYRNLFQYVLSASQLPDL